MKLVLRQAALLIGLAMLPAIGQAVYVAKRTPWEFATHPADVVTVAKAQSWGAQTLWIDARAEETFASEHIPGALPLNEDHWSERLPAVLQAWSPERRIVVYCSTQTCGLSREVALRLREQTGLKQVFILDGGWEAWVVSRK